MQKFLILQMRLVVKYFAWKSLPFANRARPGRNEFKGVWMRFNEMESSAGEAVWHIFSCSVATVRKVGASQRKTVIKYEPMRFSEIKKRGD
jgi:hypothetical protein